MNVYVIIWLFGEPSTPILTPLVGGKESNEIDMRSHNVSSDCQFTIAPNLNVASYNGFWSRPVRPNFGW